MASPTNSFSRTAGAAVRLTVILAGVAMLLMAFLISAEVTLRKTANWSFQGVDELGGYLLAVSSSIGFTLAVAESAHTRIDTFIVRLPERGQVVFHLLAMLSLSAFAVFLSWRVAATFAESIVYGSVSATPLQIPLWIPQGLWASAIMVFAAAVAISTLHEGALLWKSRKPFAERSQGEGEADDHVTTNSSNSKDTDAKKGNS